MNRRQEQAFWRMLGARPEIMFDLGKERFVERVVLRAFSSPAVNISSAEIQGSLNQTKWKTFSMLRNKDGRRSAGQHTIAGKVNGIARYIKLLLNRPAADQDIELGEVEFYGRPPTDADRVSAGTSTYELGPALPPTSAASVADKHYWYMRTDSMRVAISRAQALIAGVWNLDRAAKCLERVPDKYYFTTRTGVTAASEYEDTVTRVIVAQKRTVEVHCRNAKLPDLVIEKKYSWGADGRLVKRVAFRSSSRVQARFLTHATGAVLAQTFRKGGVYMGGDRGLGARLFADEMNVPRQMNALGARNSKTVLFQRYDLGWGVAQYRYKVNDRYCRPVTSRWHEKENHPPVYLPNGWEMGLATLHLAPGAAPSTETQLALYNGRQVDFYRMVRHLPEVKAAYDAVRRPDWVKDIKTGCAVALNPLCEDITGPLLPVRRTLQMTETGCLWDLRQIHGVWGDWFTSGTVANGYGARLDTQWLKQYVDAVHELSPRIKLGVYTWAWAVHPRSRVFQEHPEWFITKDRNGQVFNAYSNMVLNHARRLGIPESMDELVDEFSRVIRDFKGDFFYLDGGGGGQNLIDWEHLGCDQDYDYEELYRRIREVTRACGQDKAVWFNARTGPYWDIGYYEGIDRMLHAATWRQSADGLSAVKIRQRFDPSQMVVPLYWRRSTQPFFSNYCIGLGITPSSPLNAPEQLTKLPFIEAAFETRHLQWLEADLRPDWRVDRRTQLEAYALKLGKAAVISLIDHQQGNATSATLSADVAGLGLEPGRPIYVWTYAVRDIRKSWPSLSEALRRKIYSRTGWGLDLVGRLLKVETIDQPGKRISLLLPTAPHVLRIVLLSHSAGGVFSVAGRRTHFCSPDNLGASVNAEPRPDGRSMEVEVKAPEGGGEVAVLLPAGKMLAEEVAGPGFNVGNRRIAVLPFAAGIHRKKVALRDAPRPAAPLAFTGPETVAAGGTLTLKLSNRAKTAEVSLWRQEVLLYAGNRPASQGRVEIPVPEYTHEGELTVRVAVAADDGLAIGESRVRIVSRKSQKLVPVYLPKKKPPRQETPIHRRIRNIEVLRTASDSYDGYQGRQYAMADADRLTIAGGNIDAPHSRYGYGFGGLELRGVRVLTLRITNTFHDAWTFLLNRISFKPRYTSTFAGLMVDYATAQGYTRRVALGLGVLNPKRTSRRPEWGAAKAPDRFISLGDIVFKSKEQVCTIDLAEWAPPGWTGQCWLSAGAENVLPSRRVTIEILENADSPKGRNVLKGKSLGDLYKIRSHQVRRVKRAPVIDGELEPEVWRKSGAADGFFVLGRASHSKQQTRAWLVYDDKYLYAAFECGEKEKKQLNTAAKKLWNQDAVDLALDPDGDRADFHQIIVNCQNESAQFDQGTGGKKQTWKIQTATRAGENGWAVEIAIPFSELNITPRSGLKWTGNFVRYRPYPPTQEILTWSAMPGDSLMQPKFFGQFVLAEQ